MKKHILASLITLCLLLILLPIMTPTAKAAGGDLKINGAVITPNTDVTYGSGTANYNQATSTLTLTNATITRSDGNVYGIEAVFPLTIHLVGNNQLTGTTGQEIIYIVNGSKEPSPLALTAAAGGSLTVSGGKILCGDLTINSPVTLSTTTAQGHGVQCRSYTQKSGSNVSITSTALNGIFVGYAVTVETGAQFKVDGRNGAIEGATSCTIGGIVLTDTDTRAQVIEFDGTNIVGPPKVVSVSPSTQEEPISGNVVVTFDKAMKQAAGIATLEKANANIGGQWDLVATLAGTWSANNTIYTAPYKNLEGGRDYRVHLKDFQSASGSPLAEYTKNRFRTTGELQVFVNGTNLITDPDNSVQCGATADNKAVYDANTKTLTLTNATIDTTSSAEDAGCGIFTNGALNITLVGTNKIVGTNILTGVEILETLTLSGSGSLEVTTAENCITSSSGEIIFNGGSYNLKTTGIGSAGVAAKTAITVGSGVQLTAVSEQSNGLFLSSSNGTISIKDGANVTAKGGNRGINANRGTITVAKGTTFVAQRTNALLGAAMDFTSCTFDGIDYPNTNDNSNVAYQNGSFIKLPTMVLVNGQNLMAGGSVLGVSFDGFNTLTLNNATIDTMSKDGSYIMADGALNIIVQGDNKVQMSAGLKQYLKGIVISGGSLSISGGGKLSILLETGGTNLLSAEGIVVTSHKPSDPDCDIIIDNVVLDVQIKGAKEEKNYGLSCNNNGKIKLTNTTGTILASCTAISAKNVSLNGKTYLGSFIKLELTADGYVGSDPLYSLKIGGVDVVKYFAPVANPDLTGILTHGSYSIDVATATLTLNDATITTTNVDGIQASHTFHLNTVGASSISVTGLDTSGINVGEGDLYLHGGPLTVTGGDNSIAINLVKYIYAAPGASGSFTASIGTDATDIVNADGVKADVNDFVKIILTNGVFSGELVPPTITTSPTASAITYGQTLANSTLTDGTAVYKGYPVNGTFVWKNSTEQPTAAGTANYQVTFTAASVGFNPVDIEVSVTVNKAAGAAISDSINGSYTGNGTNFTYTVIPISGAEYKMDNAAWQDSNVFSGIAPNSNHTFAARMKMDANHEVGAEKSGSAVSFVLLDNATVPALAYTVSGAAGNRTITITQVANAEYSFDGGNSWSSTNTKNYTTAATVTIGIRLQATATHKASVAATADVNLAKQDQTAPAAFTMTYVANGETDYTVTIPAVAGCEYSFDGTTYTATRTKTANGAETVIGYLRKAETESLNASSAVSSTLTLPKFQVKAVTATPNGGSFKDKVSVTLTSATAGTSIYYTLNGTAPTTASTRYTAAFELTATTTVQAFAVKAGLTDSAISSFTFTKQGGGSGSSGDSSTPTPKPEPPKTDPTTGNTEAIIPVIPLNHGDISSATVTEKAVSDAIAAATKEAAKTGGSCSVTIIVDAPKGAKTVETTLSAKSLTAIADGKTTGLKISTPVADLSFNSEALKNIANAAGKDVKFSAAVVDKKNLSATQQAQVGDAPVYDFTVTSDGKTISNFNGGIATVSVPYTPKAGENPTFITVWLLDDAGKLIPIEAKYADGRISFETTHFSRYAIGYLPFTDVQGHWAYENIVYAYNNHLFAGVGNDKFAPAENMNRAMLWSVLYRMAGSPDKTDAAIWYADAQKWALANGISDGTNPTANMTREQLVTSLYRYAKAPAQAADLSVFTDTAAISNFAKDGMNWAVANKILQGANGKLNPQGNATRAEVAAMLQRFVELSK